MVHGGLVALGALLMINALYAGGRGPGIWPVMGALTSLQDGHQRRTGLGSLLHFLPASVRFNYHLHAAVFFAILSALLTAIFWQAICHLPTAVAVVLYFLGASGSFLFYEVGFSEQLVFLIFLLAAWLTGRAPWLAALAMAFSVFCHELTLFFTLPLFALLLLYNRASVRRIVLLIAPSVAAGIYLVLSPQASHVQELALLEMIEQYGNFTPRPDYFGLVGENHTLTPHFSNFYSPDDHPTIALVGLFSLAQLPLNIRGLDLFPAGRRLLICGCAMVCCALPLLLGAIAHDVIRWLNMAAVCFATVVVLYSRQPRQTTFRPVDLLPVLLGLAWPFTFTPSGFFHGVKPRGGPLYQRGLFLLRHLPDALTRIQEW